MATYPNQKTIIVQDLDKILHKENSGEQFAMSVDLKYEMAAMARLNGNAFKLWRYFLCWRGLPCDYSPAFVKDNMGFGKNAPTEALAELQRVGYLQPSPDASNTYIFKPVLDADYQMLSKEKK